MDYMGAGTKTDGDSMSNAAVSRTRVTGWRKAGFEFERSADASILFLD